MKRRLIHNLESSNERRSELRNNLTSAEAVLWLQLKNRKLDGKKFRRQHSIGPFIADFYCPECRVIVELDGAGHFTETGAERDARRTEFLKRFGVRVIRFENRAVFKNMEGVLEAIRLFLKDEKTEFRSVSCGEPPRLRPSASDTPPDSGGDTHTGKR
jgi:very-short-patch-repair endonuclease